MMLKKIFQNKDVIYNQTYNVILFIISTAIALGTVKIITATLAPEFYGIYRYVISVVSLCAISIIPGFNKSLSGYVAKGYHGTVKEITKISFITGLIGLSILILSGIYALGKKHGNIESVLFFTASIVFLPYTIFTRYQAILTGLQRFKDLLVLHTISSSFLFFSAVIVLLLLNKGVLAFGVTQLIVQALFCTIFFTYSIKCLENKKIDNNFFRHSIIITIVGIGAQVIEPGIQIYLNYAMGSEELAFFFIAKKITESASKIIKPIMRPVSMKLTRKGRLKHSNAILQLVPLCLLFGACLYICLLFGINVIGPLIVSESYMASLFYAKLLGLVIICAPLYTLLSMNLIFEKNNKGFVISTYVEQVTQVIGYVLLAAKFGIIAIAVTNALAAFIRLLVMLFYISRDLLKTRNTIQADAQS
jgi:O-antigen/teichoic acid export membrane protein